MYFEVFGLLAIICAILTWFFRSSGNDSDEDSIVSDDEKKPDVAPDRSSLNKFRANYLAVYLMNMMADWLQGPYVYALYAHYGFSVSEIAQLFVAGFLSSAVFGTVIGSVADSMGRKKLAIFFAVTYIMSCVTKRYQSYSILMLGRLLGGISTSLLFSVFEAWMVSEHFTRGFSQSSLSDTFSYATFGNGLVAIASGMIANASADKFGYVAPFMIAIVFLAIAGALVAFTWKENYGSSIVETENSVKKGFFGSLKEGATVISRSPIIFCTGMTQSLFEGAMYTFVFMWSPALEAVTAIKLPYGIIFASFMVCIMIGSLLFKQATHGKFMSPEICLQYTLIIGAFAFLSSVVFANSEIVLFLSFNLFELCCGVYFPAMGVVRSKYIPEEVRSSVMNLFRIPLNLIVVVVLLKVSKMSIPIVFSICTALLLLALLMHRKITKEYKQQSLADASEKLPIVSPNSH